MRSQHLEQLELQQLEQLQIQLGQEHDEPTFHQYHDCLLYTSVVVEYPVDTIDGNETILAEIQIRTLSMNFWATIEHSLNYKYKGDFPDVITKRLETTANRAYLLDEEMGAIRDAIQEAQALFDPLHRKLNDGVGNSDDTDEDYR